MVEIDDNHLTVARRARGILDESNITKGIYFTASDAVPRCVPLFLISSVDTYTFFDASLIFDH